MDIAGVALFLLLVLPSAGLLGACLVARRTLRGKLPPAAYRGVQVSWLVGAGALLASPFLTVYTTWTTLGRVDAPAPGLAGFDVARWLFLGGFGLFFVGAGLVAAGSAWRRFVE